MKTLIYTIAICIWFNSATAIAQEVNIESLAGKWQYESPKKKIKVVYHFELNNNYTATTEHKEKESVAKGSYEIDKKNELDRLKLSRTSKTDQTTTIIDIYLIKFLSSDTLKAQIANSKTDKWRPENNRNTMTFTRKKEKLKE